jgi:2-polyprenyl-3-methyl-5-hydroxy-6-metoxy-1,4-benzoquinol methylase
MSSQTEKELQDSFPWARSQVFADYNAILGHYQAIACLEHARGDSLLDMPCGDGLLTAIMAPRFKRVVGLDASGKHLALARETLPSATLHECLIEDFETEERFGTITMINVLEHVVDPIGVLQKAAGLLEPGGVLIVHVPNALAVNRKLAVLMGTLTACEELSPFDIEILGHRRSYSMETFVADIEAAGLKVVHKGGVFYKMLSTPQIDWFLKNGLWEEGGFGWGRVGGPKKDWKAEFCRACYELGKERPEDCNIIYACITR